MTSTSNLQTSFFLFIDFIKFIVNLKLPVNMRSLAKNSLINMININGFNMKIHHVGNAVIFQTLIINHKLVPEIKPF